MMIAALATRRSRGLLSLPPPLEGEVGEALRAGWGVRASEAPSALPPTRRVQSDAATSPSRGEVKDKDGAVTVCLTEPKRRVPHLKRYCWAACDGWKPRGFSRSDRSLMCRNRGAP